MKNHPVFNRRSQLRVLVMAGMAFITAVTAGAAGARANPVRLHPAMDVADPKIGVTQVWKTMRDQRGRQVRGQGVLVGIVDSGIDYRNPDFENPNGTTRIKLIWDQTAGGKAPAGFNYGTECTTASITSGSCSERDVEGHGTHVAGIAAGNGRSSNPPRYVGVANQADIAMVKLRGTKETDVVDACRYLLQKAQQLREPVVINLSLGNDREPHDGSGPIGQSLNQLAGPGRVIVAAAGNESLRGGHASGALTPGQTAHVRFTVEDATNGTLHLYYPVKDTIVSTIRDEVTGEEFTPDPNGKLTAQTSTDRTFQVATQLVQKDSRWEALTVLLVAARRPISGQFDLVLEGQKVVDAGKFNVWSGGSHIKFSNPDRYITVSTPADAQNVIAVAGYTTRTSYQDLAGKTITYCGLTDCSGLPHPVGSLDLASSWGPTVDSRQKPDLAAPSGFIISSRTEDIPTCGGQEKAVCLVPTYLVNGGRNLVSAGTSMASPMVAGTVALMLQLKPSLTGQQARQILRQTARHDRFTGKAAWSAQWGTGKLNALAAVQAVRSSK